MLRASYGVVASQELCRSSYKARLVITSDYVHLIRSAMENVKDLAKSKAFVFAVLGIILFGDAFGHMYFPGRLFRSLVNYILANRIMSTNDDPLAMVAIGFFVALYHKIARMKWLYHSKFFIAHLSPVDDQID
ncbi:hypothetical protein Tco_1371165 [Tanacetum coccineum]